MNAATANMINALVLVGMGIWGVKVSGLENSMTPLIPVVFGVILFVCTNFVRNHHKVVSHIAVVLTLLILVALSIRFMRSYSTADAMANLRTGAMILTSLIALIAFIKSFIDAKKSREAAAS